eukprot:1143756-Pelagomonas_calceolata.AAC.3
MPEAVACPQLVLLVLSILLVLLLMLLVVVLLLTELLLLLGRQPSLFHCRPFNAGDTSTRCTSTALANALNSVCAKAVVWAHTHLRLHWQRAPMQHGTTERLQSTALCTNPRGWVAWLSFTLIHNHVVLGQNQ